MHLMEAVPDALQLHCIGSSTGDHGLAMHIG